MRVPLQRSIQTLPSGTPLRGPTGEGGTPEAFGAGLGRSLAQAGAQTIALGNFVREQEEKKQRFDALLKFSAFQLKQSELFTELQRQSMPGATSFYPTVAEGYTKSEKEFLASLPPELQDEFAVRTAEFGSRLSLSAMEHQYKQNDTFFKQGIQDTVNIARRELGQDGSKENLDRQRATVDAVIQQSGLSEAEKVAATREAYRNIEAVAYRQAQIARLRDEAAGIGTAGDQAADLLQDLSGMTEEEASAAVLQAQAVLATAIPRDLMDSLPVRIQAVLLSTAANGTLTEEMIAAASNGDTEGLIAALKESGLETEGDLVNNPEAAIDNDESFDRLPYEDRIALLEDAKREVAAEITEADAAAKAQGESLRNALYVGLLDGTMGQHDIDTARERGILIDVDDIVKAQKLLDDATEGIRLKQLGAQKMEAGATFAPGNEDDMKMLNAMVGKEGLAALDARDSEYAANSLIPIVEKSGLVPTDVRDLIAGMIRSQDVERMYWGLDLMGQIERTNPRAYMAFEEADRKSQDLWEDRRNYLSQEEMAKVVRGPMDPAERNARAALRKEGEKLFTDPNGVMSNFNPVSMFKQPGGMWFLDGVAAPVLWAEKQLNREFQTLFLDAYELTGNKDAAVKAANKELQRVWGSTRVGTDNVLMKHPPEKLYPDIGGSWDWMEQQLRDEGILAENEGFKLVSDMQTDTEAGKTAPSYILVKNRDGFDDYEIGPDGLPVRVFFEFGEAQQADLAAWREKDALRKQIGDWEGLVSRAAKHARDTGIPIPGMVLEENAPGGIVDAFMTEDPEALAEAEQRVRDTIFGPEGGLRNLPNQFGTEYRNR